MIATNTARVHPLVSNYFATLFLECRRLTSKILHTVKKDSPVVYWTAISIFILGIGCLFGLLVDERSLMGVNVWVKPLKFSVSIGIYLLTVGYLITKYPYSRRKKNTINNIVSWTLLLEMGIIAFQASRGVQSHYNNETAFDSILFLLMGVFIGINVLIMVLFIFDTIRLKLRTTKSIQWSILLGWLVVFFGSWVGGQMISQMGHNVGVADGGAGLALVNWSTVGGDLRIAHFFGLHGIQIIPFFALWVSKKWKTSTRNQVIAVTVFGVLFGSWIGLIFYQAKQGIPFIVT
ncbi:hypothetical protein JM83_0959 [Gillisia sp. Hel_I_86]|uniref:hypothetical protein n=1 Tax=Gillisia sp. Hel_I_86 TaxID=1249981 RepID=UPI001199BD44|nr:hypothetical protein [Gillisia sp. Hel_I_86]TVZ26014.1 hypothetical protein JM83_0959 [Gillisia sp. Hel_I_86]